MDTSKFTRNATGNLVRTDYAPRDYAFVPHDIPPLWQFDPVLWPLLAAAKEALGTLNGIGQTLPNPQLLLSPLQNQEAITSSRIEGTFVTPEELLLFELDPTVPTSDGDKAADWLEVFNYGKALQRGTEMLRELPFCNRLILEMHQTLMHGVRGRNKSPGAFRKCAVQIGSNARFVAL